MNEQALEAKKCKLLVYFPVKNGVGDGVIERLFPNDCYGMYARLSTSVYGPLECPICDLHLTPAEADYCRVVELETHGIGGAVQCGTHLVTSLTCRETVDKAVELYKYNGIMTDDMDRLVSLVKNAFDVADKPRDGRMR